MCLSADKAYQVMSYQAVHQRINTCCLQVQAGSRAGGELRYGDSQLNPVQSVSDAFYSAAGGASEEDSDLGDDEAGLEPSRLYAAEADAESSYASARPVRQLVWLWMSVGSGRHMQRFADAQTDLRRGRAVCMAHKRPFANTACS